MRVYVQCSMLCDASHDLFSCAMRGIKDAITSPFCFRGSAGRDSHCGRYPKADEPGNALILLIPFRTSNRLKNLGGNGQGISVAAYAQTFYGNHSRAVLPRAGYYIAGLDQPGLTHARHRCAGLRITHRTRLSSRARNAMRGNRFRDNPRAIGPCALIYRHWHKSCRSWCADRARQQS